MKTRVVLVEDDFAVNEALRIILERSGFDVTALLDYEDMEVMMTDCIPDLYILDRHLKGMDGLDICRHLKSVPMTRFIPVIIISAVPNLRRQANAAGANAFLEKPFSKHQLLDTINQLLHPMEQPGR